MNELNIGVNRRAWTALMDLLGLLGSNQSENEQNTGNFFFDIPQPNVLDVTQKVSRQSDFTVECSIRLQTIIMDMLYPANDTRLGFIYLTKPELLTKVCFIPYRSCHVVIIFQIHLDGVGGVVSANLLVESLRIEDHMRIYDELYRERMYVINEGGITPSRAEFCITK